MLNIVNFIYFVGPNASDCCCLNGSLLTIRPVHPPYSSVFSTEFNPEYGNTDLLFWLRKRSSPKYGNAHGYLNIFLR